MLFKTKMCRSYFQFVSFSLILRETEIEFGEDRVCLPVSEDICL